MKFSATPLNNDTSTPEVIENSTEQVDALKRQEVMRVSAERIVDIFADRGRAKEGASAVRPDTRNRFMQYCESLSESELTSVADNLQALHLLNGHKGSFIRKLIKQDNQNEVTQYLASLYDWSKKATDEDVASYDELLVQRPAQLQGALTSSSLYEAVTFLSHHEGVSVKSDELLITEIAKCATVPEGKAKKWIDLISPVFNAPYPEYILRALFERVGYLPEDLTTRAAFKKVPFPSLVKCVEVLRTLESDKEYGEVARFERSRLLNAMIREGHFSNLADAKNCITLDTNGLFINTGKLHTHIPFGLLDEGAMATLKRDVLLGDAEVLEIQIRNADENVSLATKAEYGNKQLEDVHIPSLQPKPQPQSGSYEDFLALKNNQDQSKALEVYVDAEISKEYGFYEVLKHVRDGGMFPDAIIEVCVSRGVKGIAKLMSLAATLSKDAVSEKMAGSWEGFMSHKLLAIPDQEYDELSKMLNDPKYYTIYKLLQAVLANLPPNNSDEEFLSIRGSYKSKKGSKYAFFETIYQGKPSRVLLNEEKHLRQHEQKIFDTTPEYSREQYQDLERVLVSYNHFRLDLVGLEATKEIILSRNQDSLFYKHAQSALLFISGQGKTEDFREAGVLFDKLEEAAFNETDMTAYTEDFIAVAKKVDAFYRKFLYASIGKPISFIEHFMPEIEKTTISFDEAFEKGAEDFCLIGKFDPMLSRSGLDIRVVTMKYKEDDPTHAIPYHVEQETIEALRLSRGPLLNIIGGATQMGGHDTNDIATFALKLVEVAHGFKLNVVVPGTQAGIGSLFGRANVMYKETHNHLPLKEQAHLFAISPGGNTYFPSNPYLNDEHQDQTFAMSPVDSILTPFSVNWNAQGLDKLNTNYVNHIAYMEALKARVSSGERKATLVLNGGLYTLMELTESYRRGMPLFFVEDSGRLGGFLAAYQKLRAGDRLIEYTNDEMYSLSLQAIEHMPEEARVEFLQKDFGGGRIPENDDELVYRQYLYRFMKMLEFGNDSWKRGVYEPSQEIYTVTLQDAPKMLDEYYRDPSSRGKSVHGLTPIPSIRRV